MEPWKSQYVYHLIQIDVIPNHNPDRLKQYIETENEHPDIRAMLQAIYDIFSQDPDLVGIYYNAQKKLKTSVYKNEAEREALKVLFRIAEETIQKAAKAATK